MSNIIELHRKAMEMADQAEIAKLKKEFQLANDLFIEAFLFEAQAAKILENSTGQEAEPTRSVLFRSAASLAIDCKLWQDAEKLIGLGMSGNPPAEIAAELRDLFSQVIFARNLEEQNIGLEPNDLSLSIQGSETAPGIALLDTVLERISSLKTLAIRTIERLINLPYREGGTSKAFAQYPLYLKPFSPGSFVVTFTLGNPQQISLPLFQDDQPLFEELLACVELLNSSQDRQLKERIQDPAYYNNFVSMVNKIAPDGEGVKRVGFITAKKSVTLERTKDEISQVPKIRTIERKERGELIKITGQLRYADSLRDIKTGTIKLVDSNGVAHQVIVPQGMDDLVSSLWSHTVVATISKVGRAKYLEDIQEEK